MRLDPVGRKSHAHDIMLPRNEPEWKPMEQEWQEKVNSRKRSSIFPYLYLQIYDGRSNSPLNKKHFRPAQGKQLELF